MGLVQPELWAYQSLCHANDFDKHSGSSFQSQVSLTTFTPYISSYFRIFETGSFQAFGRSLKRHSPVRPAKGYLCLPVKYGLPNATGSFGSDLPCESVTIQILFPVALSAAVAVSKHKALSDPVTVTYSTFCIWWLDTLGLGSPGEATSPRVSQFQEIVRTNLQVSFSYAN